MYSAEVQWWIDEVAERDECLYELYGKPFEQERKGEYIAISVDGRTIISTNPNDMLLRAVEVFGGGDFALTRIGYETLGEWLTLRPCNQQSATDIHT